MVICSYKAKEPKGENMKAEEITTTSQNVSVVGFNINGNMIMWGLAKHYNVIRIHLTNTAMNVYTDCPGEYK